MSPIPGQPEPAKAEPTDAELVARVALRDEDAFLALYRRRSAPVYRFALRMTGSEAVAEDVTQEVFLTLARDPGRFDPAQGTLASFLFGVTRNLALRRAEPARRFVPIEDEASAASVPEGLVDRRDPHDELDRNERIERVRRAVLALPEHYREVVALCDLEEVSYVEAADALGCSVGTVRSRLHRGRTLLSEKLRATEDGSPSPNGATKRCYA